MGKVKARDIVHGWPHPRSTSSSPRDFEQEEDWLKFRCVIGWFDSETFAHLLTDIRTEQLMKLKEHYKVLHLPIAKKNWCYSGPDAWLQNFTMKDMTERKI